MVLAEKTKDIIKHFNFKFNKSFGQNFLINEEILDKTIAAMGLSEDTCVIEIGPGIGTLTQYMAKHCKKVVAIEIDEELIPILNETLSEFNNIKVINKDALKVNFSKLIQEEDLSNVVIAANLPYYVTTPIITKIFTEKPPIESITLMLQKEAGERLMAEPNTDEYGVVSTIVQYYSKIERVCIVPACSFIPQPKVESVVVKMEVLDEPSVRVMDEGIFFGIIKSSFNMRRKTLWNVLKGTGLGEEALQSVFEEACIDQKRRGETLSIEEFGRLSDEVKKKMI